ncbi:MAG: Flagellar hook-length control protein FliK [Blastocatellia bacterium]|nr:Flagellar hook-length control protein FliK [Blastocatellia bacterium]
MMTTTVTKTTFSRTGSEAAKSQSESERKPGDDFAALMASLLFAPIVQPGLTPAPVEESSVDSSGAAAIEAGGVVALVSVDPALGQSSSPPAPDVKVTPCTEPLPNLNPIGTGEGAGKMIKAQPADVSGGLAVPAPQSQDQQAQDTQAAAIKVPGPALLDIAPPMIKKPGDGSLTPIVVAPEPTDTAPASKDKPLSNSQPDLFVLAKEADTTLQAQAAQRDASFIAGYLAGATRANREANPLLSIRNQLANGADLDSKNARHNAALLAGGSSARTQGDISFASVAGELEATADSTALQVVSHVLTLTEDLVANKTRSIRLRLHPEELGEVEIQLTRNAQGKVSALLEAQRETTKQVLSQSLGQLRETLERAGVTIDRLQVKAWTGSLAGNSANHDDQRRQPQTSTGTINSLATTETKVGDTSRVHDHKLLSLNA